MTATLGSHKVISADDHMDLAAIRPDLWQKRLPAQLRERAPRVVRLPEGEFWTADGERLSASGNTLLKVHLNAIARAGIPDDGFRASTPSLRLQDMDRDGVHAQVIYGPVTGIRVKDAALKAACLQAYNDWAIEFNAADPQRLCMLAYLPAHEVSAAVAEVQRAAKAGHRGAVLSMFEATLPLSEPGWEPLWMAVEETGLPLSVHLGGGFHTLRPAANSWRTAAFASVAPMQLDEVLAIMLLSGALDRHPGLSLVLGESGLGWIPYVVERADHEFHNYKQRAADLRLSSEPSAIFHRQVYATFESDRFGVSVLGAIGHENVMWASDYPHVDSTFPHSKETIAAELGSLAEAVRRKVTGETAARLYAL